MCKRLLLLVESLVARKGRAKVQRINNNNENREKQGRTYVISSEVLCEARLPSLSIEPTGLHGAQKRIGLCRVAQSLAWFLYPEKMRLS